ncbi:hypothetical protein FQR65_LT20222 [Abscondita terminalis]|nr:hypothetical protein FQR65_LT20222 [Abscondita terminalis]
MLGSHSTRCPAEAMNRAARGPHAQPATDTVRLRYSRPSSNSSSLTARCAASASPASVASSSVKREVLASVNGACLRRPQDRARAQQTPGAAALSWGQHGQEVVCRASSLRGGSRPSGSRGQFQRTHRNHPARSCLKRKSHCGVTSAANNTEPGPPQAASRQGSSRLLGSAGRTLAFQPQRRNRHSSRKHTTRSRSTVSPTRYFRPPMRNGIALSSAPPNRIATNRASIQAKLAPSTSDPKAPMSASQPTGVMTCTTRRVTRLILRFKRRHRRLSLGLPRSGRAPGRSLRERVEVSPSAWCRWSRCDRRCPSLGAREVSVLTRCRSPGVAQHRARIFRSHRGVNRQTRLQAQQRVRCASVNQCEVAHIVWHNIVATARGRPMLMASLDGGSRRAHSRPRRTSLGAAVVASTSAQRSQPTSGTHVHTTRELLGMVTISVVYCRTNICTFPGRCPAESASLQRLWVSD